MYIRSLLLLSLLCACTTVEGSGRDQLNFYSVEDEAQLGREAYTAELKNAKVLPTTDPRTLRVQAIGKRIEQAAKKRHPNMANRMEWTWTVIDDPKQVNAWMVPGGRAAVYTGMIDFARSNDELAVVMGHEASHAIARHGTERASRDALLQAGVEATSAATGSNAAGEGASAAMQLGISLPYSRRDESEADEMGLLIAAQAGYDPRSAIELWRRMQAHGGGNFEFLSTHPSEGTRIERLQALMPQASAIYQRALAGAEQPAASSNAPRFQSR